MRLHLTLVMGALYSFLADPRLVQKLRAIDYKSVYGGENGVYNINFG